jgi:hypothetical protein
VQLPGFAGVRPPTPQPTYTTAKTKQPFSEHNFFLNVLSKKNIVKNIAKNNFNKNFQKIIQKK